MTLTSCHRTTHQMWEDTKTASRYMNRGFTSLLGRHENSRSKLLPAVRGSQGSSGANHAGASYQPQDFIPLADDARYQAQDFYPAAMNSPGDPGSPIPGIDRFHDPEGRLAELFKQIHFETDSYSIRGEENLAALQKIADYLKHHPEVYAFVEGHADERGAASYNLALGSKRANAVRDYLIDHGVNLDQLFTISYGKERPSVMGHDEIAWSQNRRSAFKLFER